MKTKIILLIGGVLLFAHACRKPQVPDPEPTPDSELSIEQLNIPYNFDFSTTNEITLTISDLEDKVSYDVYSMTSSEEPEVVYVGEDTLIRIDNSNQLIASGYVGQGSWSVELSVPAHQKFLYLKRKRAGAFYGTVLEIDGQDLTYNHMINKNSDRILEKDIVYGVNSSGQAFYFDADGDGETTLLANFDKGSYACAVDKANNVLYYSERKSPYRLWSINLTTGAKVNIGRLNKNYDRMMYNPSQGLIYVGRGNRLYTYDPFSAQYITEYKLQGQYKNLSGGDVCLGDDGSLYFLSASQKVLYKGNLDGTNINTVTISTTLPAKCTSATMGADNMIYYADNSNPAKIYKVDPETGEGGLIYQLTTYRANDFGMLIMDEEEPVEDRDGDGVPDTEDEFPDDPDRAFNNWTPGENMWGTLAFEDLWPAKGDYDFNDLVLYYKFHQITDANNDVVAVEGSFNVKHIGASYVNGFAFEMPVDKDLVASVTGQNITDGIVTLSGNGVEQGNTNAVAVVFDNANINEGQLLTLTVNFTNPISQSDLGAAPYNPFLIVDQNRDYEVHLPDYTPTELADTELLGTLADNSETSEGRYYKTEINLPWAINIPVEFVWPLEKEEIVDGYLKFAAWAESGGEHFSDWYKDLDGYRDETHLDIQE